MDKKYKLLWIDGAFPFTKRGAVYRLKALRDIPRYGVKAGDIGGFVNAGSILSHEGDCWIANEAAVYGNVEVKDNAYISGRAQVVNHFKAKKGAPYPLTTICENAEISGESHLDGVYCVSGNARINEKAELFHTKFVTGDAKISGFTKIGANCIISGNTIVSGKSHVFMNSTVFNNEILNGEALLDTGEKFLTKEKEFSYTARKTARLEKRKSEDELLRKWMEQLMQKDPSTVRQSPGGNLQIVLPLDKGKVQEAHKESELSVEIRDAVSLLSDIKSDIEAYAIDIVKVIKYPVMQDKTNSYTLEMMHTLKQAERLSKHPTHSKFIQTVMELEKKFMAAESNALRIASSLLSEKEQKRVQKAQDLLAIAADEASSEQEKKSAFIQGFKQLEGVIVVPDSAVEAFRVKYNLREIAS